MTRDEIQDLAVQLTDTYDKIIMEMATGLGKSLIAIKIIDKFKGKWNIVLAETNHELNWIEEFKKYGYKKLLKHVQFFCYQSLHKHLDGENYIFDEIHHIQSNKRLTALNYICLNNLKRLIGLSATLTRTQKEQIEEAIGKYYTYRVTLSEAIEWGIIPEPTIYFIGVTLDDYYKSCKYTYGKEKFSMVTQQEFYDKSSVYIENLKQAFYSSRTEYAEIRWLSEANKRKRFLSDCKTPHAKELIRRLHEKRFICFTGSIKQSKELSKGLSVHSKISKDLRDDIITQFNAGEINHLFATGMLREGVNLANIEAGIIVQLDNNQKFFNQTTGRSLRSITPEMYILYVKNTQDEVYVHNVLEGFNMDYVKFITMEELQ